MKPMQFLYGILVLLVAAGVTWVTASAIGASSTYKPRKPELTQAVTDWQQVNSSGFGDPTADEVTALESFNGYLFAGTHNPIDPAPLYDGAQIFRSSDGVTWTPVIDPGFGNTHDTAPPAILDFTVFKGYLYASTGRGNAAQIWRTSNGVNWGRVVNAGFGDPDIVELTVMTEFGGYLYVGATKQDSQAQVWRTFTGDGNLSNWSQVTVGTYPASITALAVFDNTLYAAVQSEAGAPIQIWSSYNGLDWTIEVNNGFGNSDNTLAGGMAVFGSYLYVGIGNASNGAQLWRTNDGTNWSPTITPAFNDANNVKVEMVTVYENQLYISVKNIATGMEVWRSSDGSLWEQANLDGFGDSNNTATNWSNASAKFSNQLYVGTLNANDGGEVWRKKPPYDVALSADQSLSGPVGGHVSYSLTVTNTGTLTDSIDLIASGQTWTTTLSTSLVNLNPSSSTTFTVTVEIPPEANDQEIDSVTITATSQGDVSKTDTAVLTTTSIAAPIYGVALSADDSLSGPAGDQVSYTIAITNTGNVYDNFDLKFSGNDWIVSLSTSSMSLAPSSNDSFTVTVTTPTDTNYQDSDSVTVTATSQGDINKTDSAVLTTVSLGQSIKIYLPLLLLNSAK